MYIIKEFVCCIQRLLPHILHYSVHKLSKYKRQFVYIIKVFVHSVLCLVQDIVHFN